MKAWWPWTARRPPDHPGWHKALLLLDPEAEGVSEAVVRVAAAMTVPDGVLDVLVPVLVPRSAPLGAPPGEETERAVLLLERVERLAGRHGVAIRGHLLRGRSLRGMLREAVAEIAPEVVVLHGGTHRCGELTAEIGRALPVIVSDSEGEDRP